MPTHAREPKKAQPNESVQSARPKRVLAGESHDVHPIPHLQPAAGNQADQRPLPSDTKELEASPASNTSAGLVHDFGRIAVHAGAGGGVRPSLTLNAPGDAHEQEADRIADRALCMPRPRSLSLQVGRAGASDVGETAVPPVVHEVLRSSGHPLDESACAFFEPRLGHRFHHVRVHTDDQAHRSAQAVNAAAYTVGSQIVLGRGAAQIDSLQGARLLAHELAHVVQQSASAGGVSPRVQRRDGPQEQEWLPELNEILPQRVGLVTHIGQVTTLIDIFGTELEPHVRLIHADAAATRFARSHGVPGIVALYDTRRGTRLDVAAARQALADLPDRYRRDSLQRLRLRPRREAPPSYWFQDPASQRGEGEGGGRPMTTSEQRAQVHIERQPSQVGTGIFVRFAYPATEVSRGGESRRVASAKQAILQAIAQVVADLGSLPPAASRAERLEQQRVRARLGEALWGLSRSSPLNVYIATEPAPEELLSGQVAAFTERVFVNLQDVGNPARLQAAIRMPLLMLRGGVVPTEGGIQRVPAASAAALQRTMLHEALHALLIRQSSDANTIWEANRAQLTVRGSPSASPKFVELVRKYLIAHEEVFAYENEASLYPPVSPQKAAYESFIRMVERFLSRRRITLNTVSRSIPVSQQVARRAVTWAITYRVPSGTVDLVVGDIPTIDLLLSVYPLR